MITPNSCPRHSSDDVLTDRMHVSFSSYGDLQLRLAVLGQSLTLTLGPVVRVIAAAGASRCHPHAARMPFLFAPVRKANMNRKMTYAEHQTNSVMCTSEDLDGATIARDCWKHVRIDVLLVVPIYVPSRCCSPPAHLRQFALKQQLARRQHAGKPLNL